MSQTLTVIIPCYYEVQTVARLLAAVRQPMPMGCRIYEVGISYHGRTYAEGKKINWRDGMRALYCILRYNLWRG